MTGARRHRATPAISSPTRTAIGTPFTHNARPRRASGAGRSRCSNDFATQDPHRWLFRYLGGQYVNLPNLWRLRQQFLATALNPLIILTERRPFALLDQSTSHHTTEG